MKHTQTFEDFLNEAKKEKFLLYTNPNNSTNRGYVVIGSAGVKDVINSAKKYAGSYVILYQGSGTNDDLQKAKKMMPQFDFGDKSIDESFLNESSSNTEILDLVDQIQKVIKELKADTSRSKSDVDKLYTLSSPFINQLHKLI